MLLCYGDTTGIKEAPPFPFQKQRTQLAVRVATAGPVNWWLAKT
jgi:hypothetical protein